MAGGGRVYNSSGGASFLLRNQRGSSASEPLDSLFLSGSSNASSTSPFLGTSSVLNPYSQLAYSVLSFLIDRLVCI